MKQKKLIILIIILFLIPLLFIFLNIKDQKIGFEIFKSNDEISSENETITIISTGDIGLVRDVNYKIIQSKNPNYPFLYIADFLRNADLTLTNLEGPLINNCPIILEGFTFCGEDENVAGLVYAGIDGASLANNHTTNYGIEGLRETELLLEKSGVIPYGLENQIKYTEVKGKKIALVGFVELGNNWGGLSNATVENISNLVTTAKENSDIVITSFHWGTEYTYTPTENQITLARLAVDNGADLVLGNHPHWIQPVEKYKDKIIIYAQGNTIFDQDWSQETREGVLYKYMYKDGKFEIADEKYTIIENNSQPRFATNEETKSIKRKVSGRN